MFTWVFIFTHIFDRKRFSFPWVSLDLNTYMGILYSGVKCNDEITYTYRQQYQTVYLEISIA